MGDVEAMYADLPDDEVFHSVSWKPPTRDETTDSVREAMLAARTAPRRAYELAVTLADTGEVVGQVTLKMDTSIPHLRRRTAELG